MTSISKNMCIDKLAVTVSEYNNKCQRTNNMNPADVNLSTFFGFGIKY